jgi:hypothetical protein
MGEGLRNNSQETNNKTNTYIRCVADVLLQIHEASEK